MTLKELIDNAINDVDEDVSDVTLRSRFKRYVNRAYKELARREGIEKNINLIPTQNVVYKPYDLIALHEIRCNGEPIVFEVTGRVIRVQTDNEIELIYNYLPDALEGEDDETITNPANDEFIGHYAKWLYYNQEGEKENAGIERTEFEGMKLVTQIRTTNIINVYRW